MVGIRKTYLKNIFLFLPSEQQQFHSFMAGKFKVADKHIAFANAVAAGEFQNIAWLKFIGAKGTKKTVANVKASELMKRPEIQALVRKAQDQRAVAIIEENLKLLPEEFKTAALSVEQIDSLHYSIMKGMVEVEELVPVVTIYKDDKGRETSRTTVMHKVKRKPNIREKQVSADAIYKRFGSYAPSRVAGMFKNVGDDDDGDGSVQRFLLLSNGNKLEMP